MSWIQTTKGLFINYVTQGGGFESCVTKIGAHIPITLGDGHVCVTGGEGAREMATFA